MEQLTFRNIDIASSGASLIAGNLMGFVSGLTLENVTIRRAGDAEHLAGRGRKPRGNVTIKSQAGSVDYSREPAELLIAHARGVKIAGVYFPKCDEMAGRRRAILIDVDFDETSELIEPCREQGE